MYLDLDSPFNYKLLCYSNIMNNQDLIESFSGIRGIYGQSINEMLAYKYAIAYCFLFCNKKQ